MIIKNKEKLKLLFKSYNTFKYVKELPSYGTLQINIVRELKSVMTLNYSIYKIPGGNL